MKKVSALFVCAIVLVMIFASCSKDNPPTTSGTIEGKWNFNKVSYSQGGITTPEADHPGNQAGCDKDYIEIVAGGTVNAGDYASGCVLTKSTGTWTKTDNNITVSVASLGLTGTFEIVSLSATELKLKITTTQGGVSVTITQSFIKA